MPDIKELEKKVANIFESAGFKVKHYTILNNIKIELLAEKDQPSAQKDLKVICKFMYEDSETEVRELIREWIEKNKEVGADKVILVLSGIEVLGEDRAMCEEDNIIIWEYSEVKDHLDHIKKDRRNGIKKLISELGVGSYSDPDLDYVPVKRN